MLLNVLSDILAHIFIQHEARPHLRNVPTCADILNGIMMLSACPCKTDFISSSSDTILCCSLRASALISARVHIVPFFGFPGAAVAVPSTFAIRTSC
jgi:hypothetical protein